MGARDLSDDLESMVMDIEVPLRWKFVLIRSARALRSLQSTHTPASVTLTDAMQADVAAALRALGLPDHARDASPHEVMVQEVIPGIEALMRMHADARDPR